VGKDVPFALLEAIAETPQARLREGLARLQAAEFLYVTELYPDIEYTFKHALTHEVTYAGLLLGRRCELQRRSLAQSKNYIVNGSTSTSCGLLITRYGGSYRKRRSITFGSLGSERPHDRRCRTPESGSSRRWASSRLCPKANPYWTRRWRSDC